MYRNNVPFNAQSVPLSQGGQQVYAPAMQGVQDSYVSKRAKKIDYNLVGVPAGVAAWIGICKGMDYFNNKLCNKEYMETPFGKLGAWGDRVSERYFNSSFAKSDAGQGLHGFFRNTKKFINEKIIGKSKVLRAIATTPTNPENKMVVTQAKGLLGWHTAEIDTLLPSFLENSEVAEQLERYGMKKSEIDKLKDSLKRMKKADRLARLQAEEFKLFGVTDADSLKAAKIRALGFSDVAQYEKIAKDGKFLENADEIFKALKNADPNMKINRCVGEGKLGSIKKFLFRRDVSFKELANKYEVIIKNPHKSALGRGLSKSLGWVLEGMTNRFAGGKMVAIMQAGILAQALVATLKADGVKDKAQTFIEHNVNDFSFVFAAPLGIMMMHRAGGMKYAGMTPEQVANFRTELEAFNAKAKAGGFANKAEYKAAKEKLTKLLQGDTKNGFFTKMFKKAGQLINIGNEKIHPYIKNGEGTKNFFRKLGYWSKNAAGYPLRFGLAMFALMPFISTTVTKASNLIFGKPKHSVLDEEEDESKVANAENVNAQLSRLRQDALQRQQAVAQHQQMAQANANAPRMDMLQRYKQNSNGQNVVNNTTNVYNNQQEEQPKKQAPIRTYIPSPVGVQTQLPNVDPANDALQRSMQAEQEALKILAMK